MALRTTVLARAAIVAVGTTIIGTVPAGHRWVVKSVGQYNASGGQANLRVFWVDAGGTITGHITQAGLTGLNGVRSDGMVQVGLPGDTLQVLTDAQPVHIWASGSDLLQ